MDAMFRVLLEGQGCTISLLLPLFCPERADTPTVAIVIPLLGPELRNVQAKNSPLALSTFFCTRIRQRDRAQSQRTRDPAAGQLTSTWRSRTKASRQYFRKLLHHETHPSNTYQFDHTLPVVPKLIRNLTSPTSRWSLKRSHLLRPRAQAPPLASPPPWPPRGLKE